MFPGIPGQSRQVRETGAYLVGMETHAAELPRFLTQREVAELLQVPERTVEDWRLTGNGPPFVKLGRHVRYEVSELVAWTRERRHG